ncbi:MAG: DUF3789 domain-containing protein [Oscillospiraceae bacterium]|nr:DUF3789 domain-containing protein [Oscillospiraceae bacterium]MCD8256542.1 DUF3789 domain-containing protein [Oscillospiraceae bacterium]
MHWLLALLIGLLSGGTFGVLTMCLLQIGRDGG